MKRALLAVVVASLLASSLLASETENLVVLARVWAAAKYLDPALASGEIDWDAALIRAIPLVRAAKSDDDLAHAVDGLLAELHDPATRIERTGTPAVISGEVSLFRWDGSTLIINAGPYVSKNGPSAAYPAASSLRPELARARAVVVDLRANGDPEAGEAAATVLNGAQLSSSSLRTAAYNVVFHSGYAPQRGESSGGYYSALLTIAGTVQPVAHGPVPARYAFVVDRASNLSDTMLALRDGGKAIVASTDRIGDEVAGTTRSFPLAGPWFARVRIAQPVDTVVGADIVDPDPLTAAVKFVREERPMAAHESAVRKQLSPQWRPEATYAEMKYPDREHRILAAFRLWSVIHYFYPYLALIGDWDAVLPEMLPRFISAGDADEYALAVLAMVAHVADGHSSASGHPSVPRFFGAGRLLAEVRVVENEFVITDAAGIAGLNRGDVVVSVDGERFRDRVERLRPYITASTERARLDRLAFYALRGPLEKPATIEVRGADGMRTLSVPRVPMTQRPAETNEPPYRKLDGNVGYVELKRLEVPQVDAMFDAFQGTRAIVLDMRGYPRGTAWAIAPRINTRGAKIGAIFRRAEVNGLDSSEEAGGGHYFEQQLPKTSKPLFRGRIVVLIDDRAISQSEHSCLFFEAANGATFIGSPTAGANGDVTNFPLPGDFTIGFTGHDVRHADGRQLQRLGIQPDVVVEPTIAGLLAGRDEVLERAIAFINAGK